MNGDMLMTNRLTWAAMPFAAAMALVGLATPAPAQDKPNVVLVLMDNLGWGELGVYGGGILRDPTAIRACSQWFCVPQPHLALRLP